DEFAGNSATELLEDRSGALWIGSRSGLYRRWPDGRVERYGVRDGLPHKNVESLLEDNKGRLWVGTRDGLCLVRNQPGGRALIDPPYTTRDGLPDNSVWDLFESSAGAIWAATTAGAARLVNDPGRARAGFSGITRAEGLANPVSVALAEDGFGNLWIGTEGGAARIAKSGFTIYNESDGLNQGSVVALFEDHGGRLQALTRTRRICLNTSDGQRFNQIQPLLPPLRNLGWTLGQVALQTRSGEWWFATGDGLCRFPSADRAEQLSRMKPKAVYRKAQGLTGDSATILFE